MVQIDAVERAAIVTCTLLQELHRVLSNPRMSDEISLGIILGTAMFCDDKVGPFRAQHLLQQAPRIVLKSDAHVTNAQVRQVASVLQAFETHLQAIESHSSAIPAEV